MMEKVYTSCSSLSFEQDIYTFVMHTAFCHRYPEGLSSFGFHDCDIVMVTHISVSTGNNTTGKRRAIR